MTLNNTSKNIIVCSDGTGNEYGENNTNVVKLYESLISDDQQKIFYDPGVGTASNALLKPFQIMKQGLSQALGLDLQKNVEDAYFYLMNTYQEGDKIFLFGFSRGAHTVRRLASLIEVCGLLHKGSENMIPYVSKMYLENKAKNIEADPILNGFKKTFCRTCDIHFVGVWDTVSAVSSLLPRPKIDGILRSGLKHAFHAVSIDEKRFQFPPNLWKEHKKKSDQVVEQVWFAGVHSDVGGFYKESGLSDISLKWMLKNATEHGLKLKPHTLEKIKPDPNDISHESWTGIWWFIPSYIYLAALIAAIVFINLTLELNLTPTVFSFIQNNWFWFWLPLVFLFTALTLSTKKSRCLPPGSKVHSSVKLRMENPKNNYRPQNLKKVIDKITWVE